MHMVIRAVLFYVVVMDYRSEYAFMLACTEREASVKGQSLPQQCACAKMRMCTHFRLR